MGCLPGSAYRRKGGVSTLTRAMAKDFKNAIPLGREGTPGETASVLAFLASPAANYLVGEIIEVNGGQLMN